MSEKEADEYMDTIERKYTKQARRDFVARMERKLHHKERSARY